MIRPKQFARMGEFHLEEAILDVLLEARHEGQCLGAAEISKRAGIFRESGDPSKGEPKSMNDAVATGMLIKLMKQGRVQRCEQQDKKVGGWELTDEEFERRRDDVEIG